ncbi:hypothetical protein [Luteolibacter marinus]|uniref:hypothetical protein n=1 Tax=Luteolibacter marinus TaxID=2776705 RepID=UPI001868B724|nr:hypothetical protein [Luteolibacter marinus]
MFHRLAALLPLFALLASCAPPYTGIPYDPATTALLRNHNGRRGHMYKYECYGISAVDNEAPKFVNPTTDEGAKVVLRPGRHRIVVQGSFQRGFTKPGPYVGRAEVDCNFEAGRVYRAYGTVEGSDLKLWIEDMGSGRRVSKIATASYHLQPSTAPMYIPIYVSTASKEIPAGRISRFHALEGE